MKTMKRVLSLLLMLCLLCALSAAAFADEVYSTNLTLTVDGSSTHNLRAFTYGYEGNLYVSLRDIATALKDTDARFGLDVYEKEIRINRGAGYTPVNGDGSSWNTTGKFYYPTLKRNALYVDGEAYRYYTIIAAIYTGVYDCWIRLGDFGLLLDCGVSRSGSNVYINTYENFSVDLQQLAAEGYFEVTNACLCADLTTREVYYAYNAEASVPIASTTKLMSYVVVMDALSDGEIHWSDTVRISEKAAFLSQTADFQIMMSPGQTTTVYELLCGMLLPSSNESAVALAEHVAGSEEAFVQRMNAKAEELGLSTAKFYNSNGLPWLSSEAVNAKLQNRMSAYDMLTLVDYIFRTYPQITDITSQTSIQLDTLDIEVFNTNPLLYNMEGVDGLKTGSTNRSGSCLVATMPLELEDGEHRLVVVEFGAETAGDRGQVSELLMRYAMQRAAGQSTASAGVSSDSLPATAEEFAQAVVKTARG